MARMPVIKVTTTIQKSQRFCLFVFLKKEGQREKEPKWSLT